MKDKIDQLSKGIFKYEPPKILLSEEAIELTLGAGNTIQGSFQISNSEHSVMKGILCSNHIHFRLLQDRFVGEENRINYEVIGEYYEPGDSIEGTISIISDCKETALPFLVRIETPNLVTSIGKIKDLYNFAKLAKKDWVEAVKLFRSDDFSRIFLAGDEKNRMLYQTLSKSISGSQAMEEFLIAMRKKTQIHLSINQNHFDFNEVTEKFMDKVILTKDTWGYCEIKVKSNADFLVPERGRVWADNFIGNIYGLEFVMDPDKMRNGMNYGQITIKTVYQSFVIDVSCRYKKDDPVKQTKRFKVNKAKVEILDAYIKFRLHKLTADEYTARTGELLSVIGAETEFRYELLKTHLHMVQKKEEKVKQKLEYFESKKEELKAASAVDYCGYLYLNALFTKDEQVIKESVKEIQKHFMRQKNSLELLWFLLYLDTKYETNRTLKLGELKRQYQLGSRSPVLYYETVHLFNDEPSLLHELTAFEIQALHWGIENDMIFHNTAVQFTYLAGHQKKFQNIVYRDLAALYEKYSSRDLLTAICSMLIKAQKTSGRYFEWYRLGVEARLKITQLHEYYMYSLNEEDDIRLAQPILMYFVYNSTLSDTKKAYLYAEIIKNKETEPAVYENYRKKMEEFALKQIKSRNITRSLAVIYTELLTKDNIDEEIAVHMPFLMFRYQITCNNPNMKGVYIIHKELEHEVFVPFVKGEAQVNIFTENAEIFIADYNDNRYMATVFYTLNQLMQYDEYIDRCYELCPDNHMLLLNLASRTENYHKTDAASIEIRKQILESGNLRESSRQSILNTLIHYYYENFEGAAEGEILDRYLPLLDLTSLRSKERSRILEYFIIRGHYDEAFHFIKQYGYSGIPDKRLLKLAMKQIIVMKNEEDSILAMISYYLLNRTKNGVLAEYLLKYYQGSTEAMYEVWKEASLLHQYSVQFEEKLLGQILFAQSCLSEGEDVFLRYVVESNNRKLIRAFLSFYSYKYLLSDFKIQREIFDLIKRDTIYEENDICLLALLKYYSGKKKLDEELISFADYNISNFVKKGIIIPFFAHFAEWVNLPRELKNRCFAEYKADPSNKVYIHYSLLDGSEEKETKTELMHNVIEGIHVKEFLLFQNESLEYFISEEDKHGNETVSETFHIKGGQAQEQKGDRYQKINQMLEYQAQGEDEALLALIEETAKINYMVEEVFKPLQL